MKLKLRKDQKKKLFGGTQYILYTNVEMTPEEVELAKAHGIMDEPFVDVPFYPRPLRLSIFVNDERSKIIRYDSDEIQLAEISIKENFQVLKGKLATAE